MNDESILSSIKGLTADSRMVRPGVLFAALPGKRVDGRDFIKEAILNGTTLILAPEGTEQPEGDVTLITDPDPRRRFALLAAKFYKLQPETTVAVTGTNGKTSTVTFAAQIWDALGYNSASLGTLGVISRLLMKKGLLTTPDPVSLQAELADLAAAGITHLGMEASSIGIEQRRLDGVRLSAAAFTNLTQDHLDYHGDMESYFQAKRRLFFSLLPSDKTSAVYVDDDYGARLAADLKKAGRKVVTFGHNGTEIKLVSQTPTVSGQILNVHAFGDNFSINMPLPGLFQGLNALCAAALVLACDRNLKFADVVPHLEALHGVPGRCQLVPGHPKGAAVYVDYAHTPAGLEFVLNALRPHTSGKLVCVFGAGGDRDKSKRPLMGAAVARLADVGIVTDDNPRSENPAVIRSEILPAIPNAKEIGDRHEAIRSAIADLQSGDVLVIAGKGHETGQIIRDVVHPFDDVEEAKVAINAL
ncbi:MAG TPA: UDP-N-acetylmuramoyl-L-alanyl-D-glutamate--2,6-diaminopimelate ligase [Alphaproteobacteria bacterium]